jgi:DNA-binding winged helix-turn-helix (wHTH) protein/TolB-like protein/Tfp pilus assembly protein PilF
MPQVGVAFGPFRLEREARVLRRGETPIPLTPKAFDTLVALIDARDRVASKAELMQRLWPDAVVEESNLAQQIFTLRRALGDDSEEQTYIRTVPRHGYRFVAEVREITPPAATPSIEPRAPAGDPSSVPRRGPRVLAVAAAAGAIAVAVAFWTTRRAEVAASTLAVVPLVNGSGAADLEYVADGLTAGLIRDLGALPGLRVLGPRTAFRYKGHAAPPQEVGRLLQADVVLTGEVVPREHRVDVHAILLDVGSGRTLWDHRYVVELAGLAGLQATIRDEVARQLARPYVPPGVRTPHAVDEESSRLCLRGRFFWNKRTADGLHQAIEHFRAAVRRDPRNAEAWSGLADAYSVLPEYADTSEDEAYPAARHAAAQALELDPGLAQAHASLAFVLFWWDRDAVRAETEFRKALELNPGYATGHQWYGNMLLSLDRVDEALAQLDAAHRADPLSLIIGTERSAALYHARQFPAAEDLLRRTIELDPRFPEARYWLARTLIERGDTAGALDELRQAHDLYQNPSAFLGEQGVALARAGRSDEARQALARLQALDRDQAVAHGLATLEAALGAKEDALRDLDRAASQRASDLAFLGTDPLFDSLRAEPAFASLRERLRRPRGAE